MKNFINNWIDLVGYSLGEFVNICNDHMSCIYFLSVRHYANIQLSENAKLTLPQASCESSSFPFPLLVPNFVGTVVSFERTLDNRFFTKHFTTFPLNFKREKPSSAGFIKIDSSVLHNLKVCVRGLTYPYLLVKWL